MAIEKGSYSELSESRPKNTLEFENLLSGFSAALISSPKATLENELNSWLKKFVRFFKKE